MGDEIYEDLNPQEANTLFIVSQDVTSRVEEFCDFYDCHELLEFAERVLWLYSVKEALGIIPWADKLSYIDIRGLVILKEEIGKYESHEAFQMRRQQSDSVKSVNARTGKIRRS